MKTPLLKIFAICVLFSGVSIQAVAQTKTAGDYLDMISIKEKEISEDALSYTSAVAHGKSARKIEKRRSELIASIVQARSMAKNMRPFEGDTALAKASYRYFDLTYLVIKEDYAKIVDMEEISEQSYDNMEAYIMAQEKANEKLDQAGDEVEKEFRAFAARHNINIIDDDSKLSKMSLQVSNLHKYYHVVYLIFFKGYVGEKHLLEAIDKKDVTGIEQNRTTQIKNAEEGMAKLSKITGFEGDATILAPCRQLLQYYQNESKNKIPAVTEYIMKQENFEKIKKAMDGKSASARTQQDIDTYNKAVNDINSAVVAYNKNNKEMNDTRSKLLDEWNNATDNFLSKHTPRYRSK